MVLVYILHVIHTYSFNLTIFVKMILLVHALGPTLRPLPMFKLLFSHTRHRKRSCLVSVMMVPVPQMDIASNKLPTQHCHGYSIGDSVAHASLRIQIPI